jgi:hypothetical protein
MLWIDAKIRIAHVRDASGDVISLIDSKAIESGCYGGTDDSSGHQQDQDKDEEAQADSRRLPMLDRRRYDGSAQGSSDPLNGSQERVERVGIIVDKCLRVETERNNGMSLQRLRMKDAVVLTEPISTRMVGNPYLGIISGLPVTRAQSLR